MSFSSTILFFVWTWNSCFYFIAGNFSNSWVERMFVQLPELEEISLPNHGGREFASKLDLLLYRYQCTAPFGFLE